MLLIDEATGRHVADIDRIHALRAGLVERRRRGLDEQVGETRLPQLTETRHADADDGNISHRSLPLSRPG